MGHTVTHSDGFYALLLLFVFFILGKKLQRVDLRGRGEDDVKLTKNQQKEKEKKETKPLQTETPVGKGEGASPLPGLFTGFRL